MVETTPATHPEIRFTRQNEPIAIQARLIQDPAVALTTSGAAMTLPDLNEADVIGLNNENKTKSRLAVSKAATKVAYDIHRSTGGTHQEKVDTWKGSFVQNYNDQTNNSYKNALNNFKIGQGAGQIDFSRVTDATAQALYDRYVAEDPNRAQKVGKIGDKKVILYDFNRFVEDVLDSHKNPSGVVNYNALKTKLDGIRFVANLTFGREGAEFVVADLEKEIKIATDPKKFCEEANQKAASGIGERSRQNRLETVIYQERLADNSIRDVRELDLINWVQINSGFEVEILPAERAQTSPHSADLRRLSTFTQLEPNKRYSLNEIFAVPHNVVKPSEYFVENPPDGLDVAKLNIKDLTAAMQTEPLFDFSTVKADGSWDGARNKRVLPHAFQFGGNPDFKKLEDLTDGDSGFLALAGISAPNTEKQAKLYKNLSLAVIKLLKNNPDYLKIWYMAQISEPQKNVKTQSGLPLPLNSFGVIYYNDHIIDAQGNQHLRPKDELLVAFNPVAADTNEFIKEWKTRFDTLETALASGQITKAQARQIEFLSHCFDMKKLFKAAQEIQINVGTTVHRRASPSTHEEPGGETLRELYKVYAEGKFKHKHALFELEQFRKKNKIDPDTELKYLSRDHDNDPTAKEYRRLLDQAEGLDVRNQPKLKKAGDDIGMTEEIVVIPKIFNTTINYINDLKRKNESIFGHHYLNRLRQAVMNASEPIKEGGDIFPGITKELETTLYDLIKLMQEAGNRDRNYKCPYNIIDIKKTAEEFFGAHLKYLDKTV